MKRKRTEQEDFWAGDFGDDYVRRSEGAQDDTAEEVIANAVARFARIFRRIDILESICEFGANVGTNLKAIHKLFLSARLGGVEINNLAVQQLKNIAYVQTFESSILDFETNEQWDLIFTSGVLIHMHPDILSEIYEKLYNNSRRYILIKEYYSPTPAEISYHGHSERLWKRDFAGEFLDMFSNTHLVDYGFFYRRDQISYDDASWFLIEKNN
jgi:spore coat polysaccharide biosynthesis protein SpsF